MRIAKFLRIKLVSLGVCWLVGLSMIMLTGCGVQSQTPVQAVVEQNTDSDPKTESIAASGSESHSPIPDEKVREGDTQVHAVIPSEDQTDSPGPDGSQSQPQSQNQNQSQSSKAPEKLLSAVPVLYYHSIDREEGNELRVPQEEFEEHLRFLQQAGYHSVTLDELYKYWHQGAELPDKPFVLTFDDGYRDNYTKGFPIARKFGFTGTVFVVTDWINGDGYLTLEQLKEMRQEGWQIESHTLSHPKLNELADEELGRELQESKRTLEGLLNYPVNYLAYPYGNYDNRVICASKTAGYKMGITTERGWAEGKDLYRLQRIYCYANMGVEELKRRMENPKY